MVADGMGRILMQRASAHGRRRGNTALAHCHPRLDYAGIWKASMAAAVAWPDTKSHEPR